MESQLPLCLKNVSYKSVSSYSWKGDLIIVQGIIYYLPTRDLEIERQEAINQIPIGGVLGLTIQLIVTLSERSVNNYSKRNKSYLTDRGVPLANINEEQLRQWLENHWQEIKARGSSFSAGLPRPVRFFASDVRNIVLKSSRLQLKTDADEYFFKFPRKYSAVIRNSLFKAQFRI